MDKGISPVIAVVLLVAIAVIAAVGVWYWVGGLASKPGGISQVQTGFTVEDCDAETDQILVRNTGSVSITGNATLYDSSNDDVADVDFSTNGGLDVEEVEWLNVNRSGAYDLTAGSTYSIIEGGLPTVQFTC